MTALTRVPLGLLLTLTACNTIAAPLETPLDALRRLHNPDASCALAWSHPAAWGTDDPQGDLFQIMKPGMRVLTSGFATDLQGWHFSRDYQAQLVLTTSQAIIAFLRIEAPAGYGLAAFRLDSPENTVQVSVYQCVTDPLR